MTEISKNDLNVGLELHSWASDTMHFIPAGIPSSADDFRLICKGQMNDIWQYVMTRVHSCQEVRNIKGNLALKRLQEAKHKSDKSLDSKTGEFYESLISDIKSVISSTQQLKRDIESLQTNSFTADSAYRASRSQFNDLSHKRTLLNTYSKYIADDAKRLDELAKRVGLKYQALENVKRISPVMLSSVDSGLETSSLKAVRKACEVIACFLRKLLQDGSEREFLSRSNDELWNGVHHVVSNYTASDVLTSLRIYADNTSTSLHNKTASIDIVKDAEQLRFKYETGGRLSDISTQPSVVQNINQLLEVNQANVFAKFIETQRHGNEAFKLLHRLEEASSILDEMLSRQFRNSDKLELARNILEAETLLTSTRSVVRSLEAVAVALENKNMLATADKEILYAKYQKIQDFKKLTDSKQNLIRVLVKQNMNSRARLLNQQSENVSYAAKSLPSHETDILQLTTSLTDIVSTETDAFSHLSLSLLPSITERGERKVSTVELSINKLDSLSHMACGQLLSKLLHKINAPYIACEYLLETVAELQNEMHYSSLTLSLVPNADLRTLQRINELCQEVNLHDVQTGNRLLPVLQRRLNEVTQALADCLQIKDLANDWWEQPGQFCAPWVTVDGMTLKQWRDKWTVSATRLQQLAVKMH